MDILAARNTMYIIYSYNRNIKLFDLQYESKLIIAVSCIIQTKMYIYICLPPKQVFSEEMKAFSANKKQLSYVFFLKLFA